MRGRERATVRERYFINIYLILNHLNVIRYFEMFEVKMKDK